MFHRPFALLALAAFGLMLGGCDSFYRAIGKEKVIPDEFAVVTRAPLAIPPDFALRPPRLGEQRPQEVSVVDQARQTVFRMGDNPKSDLPPASDNKRSPAETELLQEAGAANAPSDIRQLVNTEAEASSGMSDSFVDKLAFWRSDDKLGPTDSVINPVQEEERLAALKQTGKPPDASLDAGLTGKPTIERTPSASSGLFGFSWLGDLF